MRSETKSSIARWAALVATQTAIGCASAPIPVHVLVPVPGVTIETHEPPRRAGLDDRLPLNDGERARMALLHRVRAPGAAALRCPTAYAEEIASDGMFYFNACGRVVVLECRIVGANDAMLCRHPGAAWPATNATNESASNAPGG